MLFLRPVYLLKSSALLMKITLYFITIHNHIRPPMCLDYHYNYILSTLSIIIVKYSMVLSLGLRIALKEYNKKLLAYMYGIYVSRLAAT